MAKQGVNQTSNLTEIIPIGFYREEETIEFTRGSSVLMLPSAPQPEVINLSTQKGSGRSCKTLGKRLDSRTGCNNFSCIVIIETFSIVVFLAFLLLYFPIITRSVLIRIL